MLLLLALLLCTPSFSDSNDLNQFSMDPLCRNINESVSCPSFIPSVIDLSDPIFTPPPVDTTSFDNSIQQIIESYHSVVINKASCNPNAALVAVRYAKSFWCSRILLRSALRCNDKQLALKSGRQKLRVKRDLNSTFNFKVVCNSLCKVYQDSLIAGLQNMGNNCSNTSNVIEDIRGFLACGDTKSDKPDCVDGSNELTTCGFEPPNNCTCPPTSTACLHLAGIVMPTSSSPQPNANADANPSFDTEPSNSSQQVVSVPVVAMVAVSSGIILITIAYAVVRYRKKQDTRKMIFTSPRSLFYSRSQLKSENRCSNNASSNDIDEATTNITSFPQQNSRVIKANKRTSSVIFSKSESFNPSKSFASFQSLQSSSKSVLDSNATVTSVASLLSSSQGLQNSDGESSNLSLASVDTTSSYYTVFTEPKMMVAMYEYERSKDDELMIYIGEKFIVYAQYSDNWMWCKSMSTEREGVVPALCLAEVETASYLNHPL